MVKIKEFIPFLFSSIFFGIFEGMYWQGGKAVLEWIHLKLYGTCIDYICDATTTLKSITNDHITMSIFFIIGAILCFTLFSYFLIMGMKQQLQKGEKDDKTSVHL